MLWLLFKFWMLLAWYWPWHDRSFMLHSLPMRPCKITMDWLLGCDHGDSGPRRVIIVHNNSMVVPYEMIMGTQFYHIGIKWIILILPGVDAETLLTDGGNLAMPVRRESIRLRKGASRAIYKLKEKIAKFKVNRSGKKKYLPQLDEDTPSDVTMSPVVCKEYLIPFISPSFMSQMPKYISYFLYEFVVLNPEGGYSTGRNYNFIQKQSCTAQQIHLRTDWIWSNKSHL